MRGRIAVFVAFAAVSVGTARAQVAEPEPLALSVAYADGRNAVTPLRPRFSFWTPYFARTPQTDPAVRAVDITGTREGNEALVTVSVMIGTTASADRVAVDRVRVSRENPVEVSGLGKWGIPPVRLALISLERPPVITLPQVSVASGQIEVHVFPAVERPGYHITVTNHGHIPLRAFQFRAGNQARQDTSGRKLDARDRPLVLPGDTFEFDLPLSARTPEQASVGIWNDWQLFLVPSVLWQDGLVEGDEVLKRQQQLLDRQKRDLMPAVQQWLRDAQALSIQEARVRLEELMRSQGTNQVRMAITDDLVTFAGSQDGNSVDAFHRWAADTAVAYHDWDARLEQLLAR